jgi:hypothetical protein
LKPILSIRYDEFKVAEYIKNKLGKDYYVTFPASENQKNFDFILGFYKSNKCLKFQVKSSRTWEYLKGEKNIDAYGNMNSFFNRFKYEKGFADFYVFSILYIDRSDKKGKMLKSWEHKFLLFKDNEMNIFLKSLRKKGGGKETKFYIRFSENDNNLTFLTRGVKGKPKCLKRYNLENYFDLLKKKIK